MSEEEYEYFMYINRVLKRILTICPPIILIVGLVGNTLSIIVLSKPNNRKTSTGVMLIILAVTDSLILGITQLVNWLVMLLEYDFRNSSNAACKLHTFITYFLLQFSPWILVSVTIERVFSVLYPHRVRDVFTRKRILVTMMICALFLAALNSHFLYGHEINEDNSRCQTKDKLQFFTFNIWSWIDFAFAFAIPFCVMLSGNIIIVIRLKSSQTFRRRSTGNSERSKRGSLRTSKQKQNRTIPYYTLTALILNIAFVLLVSPYAIFAIGQPYWFPIESLTLKRLANLRLTGVVTQSLMYVNNALNFILYILSGSKFRRESKQLLCCLRRQRRFRRSSLTSNKTLTSSGKACKSSHLSLSSGSGPQVSDSF